MFQHLFYSNFTKQLCSDERLIATLLAVELALMKAQEECGILPKGSHATVLRLLPDFEPDIEQLKEEIPLTGNVAAPLVKQLISFVSKSDPEAAKAIHLGATSQDIVDTATVLKIRDFLKWWNHRVTMLQAGLVKLTQKHRRTVMMGRTLMQQARPITFGFKTAGWLRGVQAATHHLKMAEDQVLCIQLGGAVGAQNDFLTGEVRLAFAENLGLRDGPQWHTQRADLAAFASALGICAGTLGKIAKDITLLAQTEVGEVFEPTTKGRGTSSTMPHKRNPVLCTSILANVHRIPFLVATILASMPQAHERSAGLWHAEWETLDRLMGLAAGALERSIELLDGLEVDVERMYANIHLTQGLVFAESVSFALAAKIGKQAAYRWTQDACKKATEEGVHLKELLRESDFGLTTIEIEQLFEPDRAIGKSLQVIDEILQKYEDKL